MEQNDDHMPLTKAKENIQTGVPERMDMNHNEDKFGQLPCKYTIPEEIRNH